MSVSGPVPEVRRAERMRNRKPKRAAIFGAVAVAWIGVLFFFSGQSGQASGELSQRLTQILFGWWIERGADAAQLEHLLRKAAHFGIFAVEGFFLGMSLLHLLRRRWAVLAAVFAGAVLAAGNELHQLLSEARDCNAVDVAIDSAGAATGILAALLLLCLFGFWRDKDKERTTTGDWT